MSRQQYQTQPNQFPTRVALQSGDFVDRFQVNRLLGGGTFGDVYHVATPQGDPYAMKVLKLWQIIDDEDRQKLKSRFEGEFKCGKLLSPNLVQSHEIGSVSGNPYIIMDYVSGGDLLRQIQANISWDKIDIYGLQILEGLSTLHKRGIIHRDLKPENVLHDPINNLLKLTDFGIAGYLNARLTAPNRQQMFGTMAYIAPEQIKGRDRYSATAPVTDIFSYGVMMYEIITGGKYPFGELTDEPVSLANYNRRREEGRWDNIYLYRKDTPTYWREILDNSLQPDHRKRFDRVERIMHLLPNALDPHPGPDNITFNFDTADFELVVTQGEETGRRYHLSKYLQQGVGMIRIGLWDTNRPNRNQVELKEEVTRWISNYHATIERNEKARIWIIRDGQFYKKTGEKESWHNSLNGVYVNGIKLNTPFQEIRPNDLITIGDTILMFRLTDKSQ